MANMLLGYGNIVDASALEGGSAETTLPLTNLQTRPIGRVWRTTDLALASTQFTMTGPDGKFARIVSLVGHNFSLDAQYRLRISSVSTFETTLVDTGWLDVWAQVYPWGSLPWGAPNWWSGKYSLDEASGYTSALTYILPTLTRVAFLKLEIADQGNTAGYVEAGRLFVGPAWQPTRNMSVGASVGWDTDTTIERAISGAVYADRKVPRRNADFQIQGIEDPEAFGTAFEILRRAGTDGEVFFVYDPDDTIHALRRRFLARLRQMNPIEHPYPLLRSSGWSLEELL